ncbi:hypothetical protein MNBD_NITROSPINAE01-101 [hydrothermal vent metagenome]|uniref:SPOR domain-containing protein n=1 Tax=hydrothermal vent metagenome TaxID=652676 RepID=A0A3B1CFZ7_9ZZZZ
MSAKNKKECDSLFQHDGVRLFLFGLVALAVLAFLFGWSTAEWVKDEETAKVKNTGPIATMPGVTPKKLETEKIRKKQAEKTTPEPQNFTFTKTLNKETVSVVDPISKQPPSPQKKEKKETVKKPVKKPKPIQKPKPKPKREAPAPVATKKAKPQKKEPQQYKRPKIPAGKILTIQVGSFKKRSDAARLIKKLRGKGYNAYILTIQSKGQTWHRVRVGSFRTAGAANRTAAKLKQENIPTIITTYRK